MPMAAVITYYKKVPAKIAEKKLIFAEAISACFSKNPGAIFKEWQKLAYGEAAKPKPASPGILKLMGIGVKHVK